MNFSLKEAIKLGVGIYVGMMLCEVVVTLVKVLVIAVFGLVSRGVIAGL